MKILVKKLHKDAKIPTYATEGSVGMDLYAIEDYTIRPGQKCIIRSGLAFKIPEGFYVEIFSRSGLATKKQLIVLNSVGIIDSDYTGEILTAVKNLSDEVIKINKGDRYAQLILKQKIYTTFEEVDELPITARGDGGFGSTGK